MFLGMGISPVIGSLPASAWASPVDFGVSLKAWYDATDTDSVDLNGTDVSQWNDLSGQGNHIANGVAADQPAYDSGVSVEFDGSTEELVLDPIITSGLDNPMTVAFVYDRIAVSGVSPGAVFALGGGSSGSPLIWFNSNSRYYVNWTGGFSALRTSAYTSGDINIFTLTVDSGDILNYWIDGNIIESAFDANANPTLSRIIMGSRDGSLFREVKIYEMLILDKVMSVTEHNALGQYLVTKHSTTNAWNTVS